MGIFAMMCVVCATVIAGTMEKAYMMDQLEDMMEDAEKPAEKEALRRCMEALKRA